MLENLNEGADCKCFLCGFKQSGNSLKKKYGRNRSAAEANNHVQKLHSLVTALDICWGNMERGNLRCDKEPIFLRLRVLPKKKFGIAQ